MELADDPLTSHRTVVAIDHAESGNVIDDKFINELRNVFNESDKKQIERHV